LGALYPKMEPIAETEQVDADVSIGIKEPSTGTGAIA
jgi:hypothetical protein